MDRVTLPDLRRKLRGYEPLSISVPELTVRQKLVSEVSPADRVSVFNIVLIGPVFAGKSSLASTFFKALNPEIDDGHPIAKVGSVASSISSSSEPQSTTTTFTGYVMNVSDARLPTAGAESIRVFDTKGLSAAVSDREHSTHVAHMLRGLVRGGTELKNAALAEYSFWDYMRVLFTWNRALVLDPMCRVDSVPQFSACPHAVIFVLPANSGTLPSSLVRLVRTVREFGYQPLFAVTKIDCHGMGTNDVYAGAGLFDDKKGAIMHATGCAFEDVFPVQNYVDWSRQDRTCDKLALKLLMRAVSVAEQYVIDHHYAQRKRSGSYCWSSVM
jgi:hypothetical protein